MLVALLDGTTVTKVADYRDAFPNTSFTVNGPDDAFLAENNAKRVNTWLPYDASTQKLAPSAPYLQGDFVYTVKVEPLSPAEQQARLDSQWAEVRAERNRRLSASDWTQLPDVPLSEEERQAWVSYRTALRDVTQQADPFNITWPVAPDTPVLLPEDA